VFHNQVVQVAVGIWLVSSVCKLVGLEQVKRMVVTTEVKAVINLPISFDSCCIALLRPLSVLTNESTMCSRVRSVKQLLVQLFIVAGDLVSMSIVMIVRVPVVSAPTGGDGGGVIVIGSGQEVAVIGMLFDSLADDRVSSIN